MTILHSIILGIVEGITEFLPISSTGHMILMSKLLGIAESDFVKSFEIIIQLGAILAVVVFYWKKIWDWKMIKKLFVGFLPTGIIGLALYKIVKAYLLGNEKIVLWSLFIGGVVLIIFELWHERYFWKMRLADEKVEDVSYKQAVVMGLSQSLAIIPGVSRSAATIVGGLAMGLSRKTVVEFSFLLAVPTMLAATGLDLVKNYQTFFASEFNVLVIGFLVSFAVALLSIKWLLVFIRQHNFIPFGIYRIIIALVFWFTIR
ncbi:MAG: undecaprenyl-diphosphate phosphatase [Patescibacteria group bacterium]